MRAGKIIFISFVAGLILSVGLSVGGGTGLIDDAGIFGRIEGTIVDNRTEQPVIGALVSVIGTSYGATTDRSGRFEIPYLTPGSHSLKIMHLNYCPATIENIEALVDSTYEFLQTLDEKLTLVDELGGICPNPALHGQRSCFTVVGKLEILDKFGGHWGPRGALREIVRVRPVYSFGDLLARVPGVRPNSINADRIRRAIQSTPTDNTAASHPP